MLVLAADPSGQRRRCGVSAPLAVFEIERTAVVLGIRYPLSVGRQTSALHVLRVKKACGFLGLCLKMREMEGAHESLVNKSAVLPAATV